MRLNPFFQAGDYLKEIQRFTTSQYWNSGMRITAGVMVPMLLMGYFGWLVQGIPFLLGALFVGIIDSPGPIHHRRNGMLAGAALNTVTVLFTFLIRDYAALVFPGVVLVAFLYSFISIYGARASAIGTLAFVVMLLNITPDDSDIDAVSTALLTGGGGLWYAMFSMLLYRLQPYRLVEQALGEYMLVLAGYLRARAAFFKRDEDLSAAYGRVMTAQVTVTTLQNQVRELLFRTRQFVGDPSPKSRSLMIMYLDASELFEETMHSYQDYRSLHEHLANSDILPQFYKLILQVVAELEHVGLSVQAALPVNKTNNLDKEVDLLRVNIHDMLRHAKGEEHQTILSSIDASLNNLSNILDRVNKLALYTRLETPHATVQVSEIEPEEPTTFSLDLIRENLSWQSNAFRYSLRIATAISLGYFVAALFSLSHSYWIMLTIITILKPVYHLTKKRNYERVIGTMAGIVTGSVIIWTVQSDSVLFILMVVTMLLAYSFLRIYYLAFVTCLTIYLIITFHFLDPIQFRSLIGERLVDTLIGAAIAAFAARFIFPVWQSGNIRSLMENVIRANREFFRCALQCSVTDAKDKHAYRSVKRHAIIALTNISDVFQQALSEPQADKASALLHQFVIASQTLTSRISALSPSVFKTLPPDHEQIAARVIEALDEAERLVQHSYEAKEQQIPAGGSFHPLSLILSVSAEIRNIVDRMNKTAAAKY